MINDIDVTNIVRDISFNIRDVSDQNGQITKRREIIIYFNEPPIDIIDVLSKDDFKQYVELNGKKLDMNQFYVQFSINSFVSSLTLLKK